jgi:surface antigen
MTSRKNSVALAMACAIALAACESPPTKQQVGTVSGAVVGGVVGSTIGGGTGRTVAIIAGTVAGAVIGGKIGAKMDEADKLKAAQALESTPTGQHSTWTNPDSVRGIGHAVPRLHRRRHRGRQAGEGQRHGLPPARRKLEDQGLTAARHRPGAPDAMAGIVRTRAFRPCAAASARSSRAPRR